MDIATKLMTIIFKLALGLGAMGILVPATKAMMIKAAKARQTGLVSLSSINHQLVDETTVRHKSRRKN